MGNTQKLIVIIVIIAVFVVIAPALIFFNVISQKQNNDVAETTNSTGKWKIVFHAPNASDYWLSEKIPECARFLGVRLERLRTIRSCEWIEFTDSMTGNTIILPNSNIVIKELYNKWKK